MFFFALILPIFFSLCWLYFQKLGISRSSRINFMLAALAFGWWVTVLTELLSFFDGIKPLPVFVAWTLSSIGIGVFLFRYPAELHIHISIKKLSKTEQTLGAITLAIISITGVIAWIAPPNNWDSQTYHLSRIMHWIQNGNVNFYSTAILRQLHQNPWAEYAILQFQILSGGDHWANLIQWFSMVGTTVGISWLTKALGGERKAQFLAAFVSASVPMGILQASSTQTDYVLAFWLTSFVTFALLLKKAPKYSYAIAAGVALGLAVLTKATAYIYVLPFVLWLFASLMHHKKAWRFFAVIALLALSLNAGHYWRNYALYGSPLGPGQEEGAGGYANEVFSGKSIASNIVRNLALHISTPSQSINAYLEHKIFQIHDLLASDINDERTTWAGTHFSIRPQSRHEDLAGNLLHLILVFTSLLYIFSAQQKNKTLFVYSLCLISAFLLFNIYLKWQPWNSRLHLPLFLLWSPITGIFLAKTQFKKAAFLSIALLAFTALPYLFMNQTRPLIGNKTILTTTREKTLFINQPQALKPYKNAASFITDSQCGDIGIITGTNDFEYPIWVLLQKNARNITIEHVNVSNISATLARPFTPCTLIHIGNNAPQVIRLNNQDYTLIQTYPPLDIYRIR